ncbi:MAG TPA: GIY-YIG nuclease family protein [Halomicronema sp.]
MIAKRGNIKEHHFAHVKETCRPVSQRVKTRNFPSLPLYDNFSIQLPSKELEVLKRLWKQYGSVKHPISKDLINLRWVFKKILELKNGGYYFTDLGKIAVGALSLSRFTEIQEPLILAELTKLERSLQVAKAASLSSYSEKLADFKIYQAQLKRILLNTLYLIEVQADDLTFHKIGVTSRPIKERLQEINYDMSQHFFKVNLNLLGEWEHRGNVERYFKYRYQKFNFPIGALTEYFRFRQIDPIFHDLQKMPAKVLDEVEQGILKS